MPEHTSFLSYLVSRLPHGEQFAQHLGPGLLMKTPPSWQSWEPLITALLLVLVILGLGFHVRKQFRNLDEAVVPQDTLSIRTFFEVFLGYFYNMAKEVMGPERAKRYFPIVAAASCFVFFCNIIGMIPGVALAPTSNLSITFGSALFVFFAFNYYGIRANGWGYLKHLCGPWLGPAGIPLNILLFIIELVSTCVRPITLAVRLMLNMAVEHLVASILIGLFALLLPVPVMFLGVIVIFVQTLVFALLSSIYIALATDHEHA